MRFSASSKRVLRAKKNAALKSYLKQAKRKVSLYLKQNEQRLSFPELFAPLQPPSSAKSPLHWEANKSDLMELLIALDNLGIITEDGNKASFACLVKEFARFFNITIISDIYTERNRILTRSTRQTVFIDRLKRDGFEKD